LTAAGSTEPPVRLVGVFAHPDDDVYTIGGTLALHRDAVRPTLVFCTSGGAGPISDEALATRETLAEVREREQAASMAVLGVRADVRFLRHPDYTLPDVPFEALTREIEEILREVRPHVVVTFGPDGMTSHQDHIRAGEATAEAFRRTRLDGSGGTPPRLYQCALPRSAVDGFYAGLEALDDAAYGAEGTLFNLVGVEDDRVAVVVDTRPVLHDKLQAILAHETQRGELERIPEPLRRIHLETEWFVQAWPAVDHVVRRVTDPFAGFPGGD
jgi:LmbE family N-acetylglucosaminyl deacetylase